MPHMHFTFPENLKHKLVRIIPERERSRFVSQATERALQMLHLKKQLLSKKYVGTYPDANPNLLLRGIRRKSRPPKKFS